MQSNGRDGAHHTPTETASLLPSRPSSSSSSGNDLRESLMSSSDSHDEASLAPKPTVASTSTSPQPTFTHFNHQQSITKDAYDLTKIRGQGWIGQILPGPHTPGTPSTQSHTPRTRSLYAAMATLS